MDIVEKLKDLSSRMRSDASDDECTPDGIMGQTLNSYADEVDSLVKVAIDVLHSGVVVNERECVNSAALREALEKCANWGEQIDYQFGSRDETVYTFRDERRLAHNISECARAALSEPPRNCDRPECATTKAAQDVWSKEDGGKTAYYEWLLALATKGGAK